MDRRDDSIPPADAHPPKGALIVAVGNSTPGDYVMSTPATVHAPAEKSLRVSLPKVTIAMIFCGIVSAAGIGAASAAMPDEESPSMS